MSTTFQPSPHNPFRSNPQTPSNTGDHASPSPAELPTSNHSTFGSDEPAALSNPSDSDAHRTQQPLETAQPSQPPPSVDSDDYGLNTDLPPAYTPAADIRQGEATLEYGPTRPFQQPLQQPRPTQPHLTPQPTGQSSGWSQPHTQSAIPRTGSRTRTRGAIGLLSQFADELERQLTATARELSRPTTYRQTTTVITPTPTGSWASYPGQRAQPYHNSNHTPILPQRTGYPAPPVHPQHTRSVSSPHSSPSPNSAAPSHAPTSDFARDFYAAGADASSLSDSMSSLSISTSHSTPNLGSSSANTLYPPPPGPPPGAHPPSPPSNAATRYAPPPGPPPALPARPRTTSPVLGPSASSATGPNDGRPTLHPTPGHPLMRDGRVLVYPNGYMCDKCDNTGYKHADPMHPCKRCWQKFAKPFIGPLTWASWGDGASPSDDLHSGLRRSATSGGRRNRGNASHHSTTLQRPLPLFRPPQNPASYPQPQGPGMSAGGPYVNAPQNQNRAPALVYSSTPAVNGNTVTMTSGDPRLGGRLCWNCSGRGLKNVLGGLLGEEECFVCKGIGRIY